MLPLYFSRLNTPTKLSCLVAVCLSIQYLISTTQLDMICCMSRWRIWLLFRLNNKFPSKVLALRHKQDLPIYSPMRQVNWCFFGNISSSALHYSTRNEVGQDNFSQGPCPVLIPDQRRLPECFVLIIFRGERMWSISCRVLMLNITFVQRPFLFLKFFSEKPIPFLL